MGGEDLMVEDPQEGEHYEIDNDVLENFPQPGDHDNGGEDNNENGGEDLMVEDPQEGEH
ncbi:hypothetical protein AVEN_76486-1, partial [Araneus ventricosus]